MGRKTNRQKGKEHGSQWSFVLRVRRQTLFNYKESLRAHINKRRPKKLSKKARKEYDEGFRIGFKFAEDRRKKAGIRRRRSK